MSSRFRPWVASLLATVTIGSWATPANADSPSAWDEATRLTDEKNLGADLMSRPNMHSLLPGPDGTKGGGVSRVVDPIGFSAPFTNNWDFWLHMDVCQGPVVWARAGRSESVLSSKKTMILTRTSFANLQVLHEDPSLAIPSQFSVVREGGAVTDEGERLRFVWYGQPAFIEGETYLLLLRARRTASANFYPWGDTMRVNNNTVWIGDPAHPANWQALPSGVSFDVLKAEVQRVLAIAPCGSY